MSAKRRLPFCRTSALGISSRKARRGGSFEALERREMMAADWDPTAFTSLAPITANQAGVYAPVVAGSSAGNDSIATATNLGVIQGIRSTTGGVGRGDANDYFRIVLDEPGYLRVTLDQMTSNLDMALYNSAGQQLGISTRPGTSIEQIGFLDLSAGNYYARVATGAGSANSNYRLTASVDIAGDTLANSRDLGNAPRSGSQAFTDWVGPGDTSDYFRFNVTQQSQINLKLDQLTGDADLYLYDNTGRQIGSSRKSAATSESITGAGSGTFYVRVDPYGSSQSNYRLTIGVGSVTPPPQPAAPFRIDLNMTGLTSSQQNVIRQAARRWEQVIVGDLPDVRLTNGQVIDDLRIDVSVVAIDGVYGTAGNGGYERLRGSAQGGLPYYGTFRLDSWDVARMEQAGTLFDVALHEMGHVLGLGTLWSSRGLLGNMNTNNPGYYGRAATMAYNQIFGTSSAGVPVDPSGAHWRESVLGSELMTPTRDGSAPLSTITVGSLADLGYRVNYAAADSFSRAAAISLGPAPAGTAPAGSGGSPAISANLVDNCHAGHSHDAPTHCGGLMSRVGDRSSDPRAAKIAAFDFWRARSHHTDFDHDASPTAVRAAFESAWDDLAAEPPGALVA